MNCVLSLPLSLLPVEYVVCRWNPEVLLHWPWWRNEVRPRNGHESGYPEHRLDPSIVHNSSISIICQFSPNHLILCTYIYFSSLDMFESLYISHYNEGQKMGNCHVCRFAPCQRSHRSNTILHASHGCIARSPVATHDCQKASQAARPAKNKAKIHAYSKRWDLRVEEIIAEGCECSRRQSVFSFTHVFLQIRKSTLSDTPSYQLWGVVEESSKVCHWRKLTREEEQIFALSVAGSEDRKVARGLAQDFSCICSICNIWEEHWQIFLKSWRLLQSFVPRALPNSIRNERKKIKLQ